MNTCTYTARVPNRRGGEDDYACGNAAHDDGKCKFHLDGYLKSDTADEVRDLFWELLNDATGGRRLDCIGYALPSLVDGETDVTVGNALRLDLAKFTLDGAGLSRITFKRHASFLNAEFNGSPGFRECTFKQGANFSHAVFHDGTADFKSTVFLEAADFFNTEFADACFDWAVFAESQFNKATFLKDALFRGATFGATAKFHSAEFLGVTRFNESNFRKGADFSGALFEGPAHFRGLQMRRPDLIKFDGNVSNVSFLNTNLKEIDFGSMTTWSPEQSRGSGKAKAGLARLSGDSPPKSPRRPPAIWNQKWRIYDERILGGEGADRVANRESVLSVYRDLRDNFDRQLRYDVSGGFFVREMEIGRKYKSGKSAHVALKPIYRRALTWHAVYNTLAEYGQSLGRPLLFLAPVFAAGSLLLWCPSEALHGLEVPCEDGLEASVLRSLVAMTPIPLSGHPTSPVDVGLKVAALPAVATFLIALRRRFEKTRRH